MEILKLKQIIEINPTNEFKSRLGKAEYKIYELNIGLQKTFRQVWRGKGWKIQKMT